MCWASIIANVTRLHGLVSVRKMMLTMMTYSFIWFRSGALRSGYRSAPERSGVVMMSLRSAPEWLWSAPERLSKQYMYRLVSVMKMMFPMISYFFYMMTLRRAPEWLWCRCGVVMMSLHTVYLASPGRSGATSYTRSRVPSETSFNHWHQAIDILFTESHRSAP